MNKKGFTLAELLATLIILGIVIGIVLRSMNVNKEEVEKKSETIFINNLKDAIEVYMDTDAKDPEKLTFNEYNNKCIKKEKLGDSKLSIATLAPFKDITFETIIDSSYKPITEKDLINPANETKCYIRTIITIYRDDDYVYYYEITAEQVESMDCLKYYDKTKPITNLPTIGDCQ